MYGKLNESDLSALQLEAQRHPQRLKFLIMQASKLPSFPLEQRIPENEIQGCEAKVWLVQQRQNDHLELQLDSASRVVKGLLALIFFALHQATVTQVENFDLDALLKALGLQDLVSVSRRNGLRAVVSAIQNESTQNR
ncbi:Cysteine desulfuration protein SufE [Pseudidiomarina piscicola]|uniref:Cysteine desulfuration protein SufE n=1 Tax=Pseudidiomarina piscicola TaxID=2614830 RepID=A0A6S6WK34_9GAMM|nr:SufE family protein [Pseudidiomarina piscicola]CAB0151110.1 Cysteine desulfuration protein SufE [Pseudidiomarina piscicola]VZT40618.1 Cysteine desulfuration protein SufE [Pseudomonas aeruginosa]